jgi:Flp pilus assembly protein TadG
VLYDPVAPERAIIDQFWDRWSVTAILFAIGAPLFVAGLVAASALWPEPRLHEIVE